MNIEAYIGLLRQALYKEMIIVPQFGASYNCGCYLSIV